MNRRYRPMLAIILMTYVRMVVEHPPRPTPPQPPEPCPSTARIAVWLAAKQLGYDVPLGKCP